MPTGTVKNSRAASLAGRISRLDTAPRREAVALGLVDALLEGDTETLGVTLEALRDARAEAASGSELAGWLDAATACAYWGLERVPGPALVASGTHAHDFLRLLEDTPQLGSLELRRLLETDESEVSRTGRRLLEGGLVTRRKAGRKVFWQLSPRGRRALAMIPEAPPASGLDFWHEALRRGFEGAYGDEPGPPRKVDPTRELIIRSTLDLHTANGIRATTMPEIADRSGVPIETIERLFPTEDDLVRSCGSHVMESLRLPPADRAADVFAGVSSQHERIRRLVETAFGAYERGGAGIAAGRRERGDVPVVDESMRALDQSFDALVAEAVRPRSGPHAGVRALTDLEVWRTLRDQGAEPEAAVEQATTAVERWLEAQPS